MDPGKDSSPRPESEQERDDRNLAELLQELRVAGLGVQVLFGFLLSLPFTMKFAKLSQAQRDIYLISLVLAAVSTALLVGPVAYHRLVFRRRQKEHLVRSANVMAVLGLAAVGLAVSAAVLLVVSFVASGAPAVIITVIVVLAFGGLWFGFPLARRRIAASDQRAGSGTGPDVMPPPARVGTSDADQDEDRGERHSGRDRP